MTLVVSVFTAAYTTLWPQFFPNSPLSLDHLPVFDGRCVARPRPLAPDPVLTLRLSHSVVQYTSELEIQDYLRWRQVDSAPFSLPLLRVLDSA